MAQSRTNEAPWTMSGKTDNRASHDDGTSLPVARTYGLRPGCRRQVWHERRNNKSNSTDDHCSQSSPAASGKSTVDAGLKANTKARVRRQYGRRREHLADKCQLVARVKGHVSGQSASARRHDGGGSSCRFRFKADEILLLVQQTEAGGEAGRASAITLAKACKSSETRKSMYAHGAILSGITKALLASLHGRDGGDSRGRHLRDEALVHCLAVTVFILSKDAAVAKGFSAAMVSALVSIIEDSKRRVTTSAVSDANSVGAVEQSLDGDVSRPRPRSRDEHQPSSVFDLHDDSNGGWHSGQSVDGGGKDEDGGTDVESDNLIEQGMSSDISPNTTNASALALPYNSTRTDHGSADVLVRARMLLDISDMIPWGIANRHLVSAADLALGALLNMAAQASTDASGGRDGGGGGDSVGEEVSTQESEASQSQGSSVVASLTNGKLGDGDPASNGNPNAGVMEALSRVGPKEFLFSLAVEGAAVLEALSNPAQSTNDTRGGGVGTDPSSLRQVHQLLLGLRLLDLATLNSSSVDRTKISFGSGTDGDSVGVARPGRTLELATALLLIVSRCQNLLGKANHSNLRKRNSSGPVNKGESRRGVYGSEARQYRQQQQAASSPFLGEEVTSRVHECMLAALRVLINVTHHDAAVCAEVATRDGVGTLMSCLVAHSESPSNDSESDGDDSSGDGHDSLLRSGQIRLDSAGFSYSSGGDGECGMDDISGSGNASNGADSKPRRGRAGGSGNGGINFDTQVCTVMRPALVCFSKVATGVF